MNKNKKGRPKGSKNKPKFQMVELSSLTNMFQPTVKIPVCSKFLSGFFIKGEDEKSIKENNIKFNIIPDNE